MKGDFHALLERVRGQSCISLVGGGGKTTLMYALADALSKEGRKVIITTTTHIQKPADRPVAISAAMAAIMLHEQSPVVYGSSAADDKLSIPQDFDVSWLMHIADHILVEADGAKGFPCKVPRTGEPVIDPNTDLVLGVAGLSGLGKPLKQVCFRLGETIKLLHTPASRELTPELLVKILTSKSGTRKNVDSIPFAVVLNQCDVEGGWENASRLRQMLAPRAVYALSLLDG